MQKVSSIGGMASCSSTRPNDTTAYSIGDVCGESPAANMIFTDILLMQGGHFIITGVSLEIDVASIPSGMNGFRLHLYNSVPTPIADNTAYNLPAADRSKYIGWIDIDTPVDVGDTLCIDMDNINKKRKLATGSTTIYGILETRGAYTPTAQAVKTITIHVVGV